MTAEDDRLQRLDLLLEQLAEREAAQLVEEARIEARVRVRSLLTEAIAERLLERAEAELTRPDWAATERTAKSAPGAAAAGPPVATRPSSAGEAPSRREAIGREAGEAGSGVYVYGVTAGGYEPPTLPGVDGVHPVEAIEEGGLSAIASIVSLAEYGEEPLRERLEDIGWIEPQARRHEEVLDALREEQVGVVPMRLCTIYRGADSVREMLVREEAFLLDALERLERRTEWGVKLFLVEPAPEAKGAQANAPAASTAQRQPGPGEAYLRERRQTSARRAESAQRLEELGDELHRRLSARCAEARLNPLQPPELSGHDGTMLLNGVYLVDSQATSSFHAEVAALQGELAGEGLDVVLTGPWPPYNFVSPPPGESR